MDTIFSWDTFSTFLIPLVHSFIPLFVAMDPIGIIPLYNSLTLGMSAPVRRHVAVQAIVTGFLIALAFIFVGRAVFRLLGITVADFQIAGGVLLFILAVIDLISSEKPERIPTAEIGVVPIGTPLIVGPAVLTVLLMTVDLYGLVPTILSIVLNLLIMTGVLLSADKILRLIGEGGARGTAKVVNLLLAAIGVMMVRRGIIAIFLQIKF